MMRSASYKPCRAFGRVEHCLVDYNDSEPCWGQVDLRSSYFDGESSNPCFLCEGHADAIDGGAYVPETVTACDEQLRIGAERMAAAARDFGITVAQASETIGAYGAALRAIPPEELIWLRTAAWWFRWRKVIAAALLALALATLFVSGRAAHALDTLAVGNRILTVGDPVSRAFELLGAPDSRFDVRGECRAYAITRAGIPLYPPDCGAVVGERFAYYRDGKTIVVETRGATVNYLDERR